MAFERIELDVNANGVMKTFHTKQFDVGRPIILDLVNSGDAYTPAAGATFELHCRKVDDNIVIISTYDLDGNTLTFASTEQLTACVGKNLATVKMFLDDMEIGTMNFFLDVTIDPDFEGLTSETQIENLYEQVEEITEQVIGDNYYDKTEVDDLLDTKADASTTYTKTEVDTALNLKADRSTTYTKTETNNLLAGKADASDTYSKAQVDNALALKANSADLATVATTGDYDDLLNKPTIPTKTSDLTNDSGYITETAIDNILPVVSLSGSIASFNVGIEKKLKSITVDNSATIVTRCGVNLWDEEWELGTISTSTGENLPSTTQIRSINYIGVRPSTTYYNKGYAITVYRYDANKNFLGYSTVQVGTFTTDAQTCYIRFWRTATTYNNDISINYPSTDTTYHAYNGTSYPVADIDNITTLNGVNNIYADVGDVSVQAYDSIQHYIDTKVGS